MRKFIRNWEELAAIPNESNTHILEIYPENGYGWLRAKNPKNSNKKLSFMRRVQNMDVYLSTHTFYGHHYKWSSKVLRSCGFDVELDNWERTANK